MTENELKQWKVWYKQVRNSSDIMKKIMDERNDIFSSAMERIKFMHNSIENDNQLTEDEKKRYLQILNTEAIKMLITFLRKVRIVNLETVLN